MDNTAEALAGILRPGNANANTAADHITVTDEALAQLPDEYRHGTPILVRADGAGATKAWLAHLRSLREQRGLQIELSVGFSLDQPAQGGDRGAAGDRVDGRRRRRRRAPPGR